VGAIGMGGSSTMARRTWFWTLLALAVLFAARFLEPSVAMAQASYEISPIGTDAGQAGSFNPPFPNHGIMHGNQRNVDADGDERVFDGLLAAVSAFDNADGFVRVLLMDQSASPFHIFGPERYHDFGDGGAVQELADGVDQDRRAFEKHELLAAGTSLFAPHAGSEAGGGEDDGDIHGRTNDCIPVGGLFVMRSIRIIFTSRCALRT